MVALTKHGTNMPPPTNMPADLLHLRPHNQRKLRDSRRETNVNISIENGARTTENITRRADPYSNNTTITTPDNNARTNFKCPLSSKQQDRGLQALKQQQQQQQQQQAGVAAVESQPLGGRLGSNINNASVRPGAAHQGTEGDSNGDEVLLVTAMSLLRAEESTL